MLMLLLLQHCLRLLEAPFMLAIVEDKRLIDLSLGFFRSVRPLEDIMQLDDIMITTSQQSSQP